MTALDSLAALLPDKLVVVDVGCRWGFAPQWEPLARHVALVGFDANEAEVERLRAEFRASPHMRFIARTLGSSPGHATLIHRAEEAGTSLLDTAWPQLAHLPEYEGGRVTHVTRVEVSTLDQWVDGTDDVSRIDALKLDTQGYELEILRGAEQCLAGTRHVEVEVAFNPLFEGGPLFGDVDAFLRERGFVLWHFRDLVHHALREAPSPPLVTEHLWYEGVAQPIRVPGGHLMWCNAHFVREDMYLSDCQLGWEVRLRDACLMHALEFHDLAVVSLKRLLEEADCPEAAWSRAELALAEWSSAPEPEPPAPSLRERLVARARTARARLS